MIDAPKEAEPPANVVPFPSHRAPRVQSLSDDQMTRLIWLLNQTELIEQILRIDFPKLTQGCPVARQLLAD